MVARVTAVCPEGSAGLYLASPVVVADDTVVTKPSPRPGSARAEHDLGIPDLAVLRRCGPAISGGGGIWVWTRL